MTTWTQRLQFWLLVMVAVVGTIYAALLIETAVNYYHFRRDNPHPAVPPPATTITSTVGPLIVFSGQCSVTQRNDRGGDIEIPAPYRAALLDNLKAQEWVSSATASPLDDKTIWVYWSAAYVYPDGEPLRSLQRLCDDALTVATLTPNQTGGIR